jgi:tripartite ATP-independent transporter DctP family solute receptor
MTWKETDTDMKYRRLTGVMVSVAFLGLLTGCAGKESTEQRYAYPLGTASPEDTVTQIYAEKFAEEADRLSDGRIKITVYPNSVLGGDRELLEGCYDGDIPFVVQNTAPQVNFIDDTAIFDAPCVFDDIEELRDKVDQPEFLSRMQESYRDAGYELLGYADQGFRVMSSNKEVSSFSDFKGQKIRTMEDPYQLSFWKKLKANPTPMSFSEVYIGLQQHTIDAQENPYEVIVSNRLYEQQDYIIETNHVPHLISLIVSEDFYKKLSEEDQKILREAEEIAKEYAREKSDERISEKIREIEESGTKIITPDEETREQMKEASTPVYDQIEKVTDPELFHLYTGR